MNLRHDNCYVTQDEQKLYCKHRGDGWNVYIKSVDPMGNVYYSYIYWEETLSVDISTLKKVEIRHEWL